MKRILFSFGFLGMVFSANSQVLLSEDFNALNVGNLGTDATGNTAGQGGWFTYAATGATNSDWQIVNEATGDNALQLKGNSGPTATTGNPSKTRWSTYDLSGGWTGRTSGNNVLYTEFYMNTGGTTTSLNNFNIVVYSTDGINLGGFNYISSTKVLRAVCYKDETANGGAVNSYNYGLGAQGAALTLTANAEINLGFSYNKTSGEFSVFGLGAGASFYYTFNGAGAGKDIQDVDIVVTAGANNAASATLNFDDFQVEARCATFPPTPTFTAIAPICSGASLTLPTSSTDATPIAGTWSPVVNNTATTTYTFTPNSGVCANTTTQTVTVNAIPSTPVITAGGATTFCQGSNVALNITSPVNGVTYNWSNSSAGTSLTATSAGTYTVTASQNGCNSVASNSIVVTVNTAPAVPSIQAAGATTFCQGGSVNLSVTPANNTTYLWSDNTTTATTLNVTSTGSYTVTATSAGCSSTSTATAVTVNTIPTTPVITAGGATTFCQGSNVALNVTSPVNGVTYNWSNSSVGTSLNATTAGSYTVTASNGGCNSSASNSISVSVNNAPTTPSIQAAGATTFCQGGSVNLSVTPANNTTYLWSDNTTTATTLNVTSSGSYTVTATSAGCSSTSTATVVTVNTNPTTPVITAGGATTFCQGSNVALNVTSPVNGVTYNWSNSTAGTSLTASTAGSYTVTASNGGCNSSASNSISVTVNNAPTTPSIQAAGATTFCQGGSVNLSVTPANNTTYLWSDNTTTATSLTATASGSYTVTATSAGCSSTSNATVVTVNTAPTAPVINASGSTSFCQGGSVTLSITPANNTTYTWSTNATTNSIVVSTSGSYTVTATANSCSSTSQAVTVSTSNGSITTPVILSSGSTDICSGNSVTLSVSPANNTTYAWSNNASGVSTSVSTAGSYTVTATSNGCTATSTPVVVTLASAPTKPVVTAFGNTTFCQGGSVSLSVAPEANTTYTWSNNGTGNTVLATTSGYYVVTATKGGCSSVSNPVTVTVNPIPATPVINVSGNTTICQGGSSVLSVVPVTSTTYLWSNSSTGASNTVTTSGNYLVTATSNGCSATSSIVTLSFVNCAGIEETSTSLFKVFPNPSNDIITISFSDAMSTNGTINFVAADGKLVEKREYTNSSVETFDVKSLNPGVYFFQIENKIEKVVVQ